MDSKVRWKWHTKESLKLSTNQQNLPSWKSGKKSKPKKKKQKETRDLESWGTVKRNLKFIIRVPE